MEAVLKHKLFDPAGELRFLSSTTESWDAFIRRQAAALHAAIGQKDWWIRLRTVLCSSLLFSRNPGPPVQCKNDLRLQIVP